MVSYYTDINRFQHSHEGKPYPREGSNTYYDRVNRLLPLVEAGSVGKWPRVPKWVRIYDNGDKTVDRYTVVMTGNYRKSDPPFKEYLYLGMSSNPYHPQGYGQYGASQDGPIDRPAYSHIGKRIKFADLPEPCQDWVMQEYIYLWDLGGAE